MAYRLIGFALIHNSLQVPETISRQRDHPLFIELGWTEAVYVLIVVARLEPVKGHPYLIEAVSQLAPQFPHLRCLIVGDGRTRSDLEAQAADLKNHIHFAGFRDDIAALLAGSDAFCLPSLSEGLPYALLEAGATRLPILARRVGGMAELLTHHENAYLIPPMDSIALAEGLY